MHDRLSLRIIDAKEERDSIDQDSIVLRMEHETSLERVTCHQRRARSEERLLGWINAGRIDLLLMMWAGPSETQVKRRDAKRQARQTRDGEGKSLAHLPCKHPR